MFKSVSKYLKSNNKLSFSPGLYLGEGIKERNLGKIKQKLNSNPFSANVMLIALSENESDQLDIISSKQLIWPLYKEKPLSVVGISKDYDGAVELVLRITHECLDARNDCSLKEYLKWQ